MCTEAFSVICLSALCGNCVEINNRLIMDRKLHLLLWFAFYFFFLFFSSHWAMQRSDRLILSAFLQNTFKYCNFLPLLPMSMLFHNSSSYGSHTWLLSSIMFRWKSRHKSYCPTGLQRSFYLWAIGYHSNLFFAQK